MRKVIWLLLALAAVRLLPRALRREAQLAELITALFTTVLAMATTNTAKAYETESRVGLLETRAGNLEQGIIPNLQGSSTIGQIQATANAALPAAGGTVTGTLTIDGDCGVHGNLNVTSDVNVTGDVTTAGNIAAHGGTIYWGTGGTAINTSAAEMVAVLDSSGNFNATMTIYGSLGVHGNINYTGSLNHT